MLRRGQEALSHQVHFFFVQGSVQKICNMIYGILNIFYHFEFQEAQKVMLNCNLLGLGLKKFA